MFLADVDRRVPNAQLILEKHPLASLLRNRCVAEQYSFTLPWDLLIEARVKGFRSCLYRTAEAELMRFRHLVVHGVMATNIADKDLKGRDLKGRGNAHWAKTFHDYKAGASTVATHS